MGQDVRLKAKEKQQERLDEELEKFVENIQGTRNQPTTYHESL
jgi:hypothetical protein